MLSQVAAVCWLSLIATNVLATIIAPPPDGIGRTSKSKLKEEPQLVDSTTDCDWGTMDHQRPRLEFRTDDLYTYLDVYNPRHLKGPACSLDGAILYHTNDIQAKFLLNDTWPKNTTQLNYAITKSIFRLELEEDGYVTCTARIAGCSSNVTSRRMLVRMDGIVVALAVLYNATKCTDVNCDPKVSTDFLREAASALDEAFQEMNHEGADFLPVCITNRKNSSITIVFQVILYSGLPPTDDEILVEKYLLDAVNKTVHKAQGIKAVRYIRSSTFCHENDDEGLHWPTTRLGHTALPDKPCLNRNKIPVTRKCVGDFIRGAFWKDVNRGKLSECMDMSNRSMVLRNISLDSATLNLSTAQQILQDVASVLKSENETQSEPLTPLEIGSIADTFNNLQSSNLSGVQLPKIANITNAVLLMSQGNTNNSLRIAQKQMNTSNIILDSLDQLLHRVPLTSTTGIEMTVGERMVTMIVDVHTSVCVNGSPNVGLRGLAMLKNESCKSESCNNFLFRKFVPLSWNDTLQSVLDMNMSVAALLPETLVLGYKRGENNTLVLGQEHVPNSGPEYLGATPPELLSEYREKVCKNSSRVVPRRVVVNLFWNDLLFGSGITNGRIFTHVISVAVDGEHQNLVDPLTLFFDNTSAMYSNFSQDSCNFWDFRANNSSGHWSDVGCSRATTTEDLSPSVATTDICVCTHLTSFSELIFNPHPHDFGTSILMHSKRFTLDIVSVVGCFLSLMGLFGIFLTAVAFPEWRRRTGKKLQLHLSTATAILITTFLCVATIGTPRDDSNIWSKVQCIATGILLTYSILSLFLWMLAIALFQRQRLTNPLQALKGLPHYLLISGIFAWGLPIIPSIILAITDSYKAPSCYPHDDALTYSITIPVGIILILNALIFGNIIWSIFNCIKCVPHLKTDHKLQNTQCEKDRILQRLAASVYLFFLLGLCWLFGYLQWSILFCITASLQGFSLFLFYVVLDKTTREKWRRLVNRHLYNSAL